MKTRGPGLCVPRAVSHWPYPLAPNKADVTWGEAVPKEACSWEQLEVALPSVGERRTWLLASGTQLYLLQPELNPQGSLGIAEVLRG